jgi:hypothetical protein
MNLLGVCFCEFVVLFNITKEVFMQFLLKRVIRDKETKELKEIDQKLDPDEIACYYKDTTGCFISTKSGILMKLATSFGEIETIADDIED